MKPSINLLHLRFFCDAVSCGSVSEAAKKNYVTQSAVSQAIVKLEISLGISLLVHSRQKFQVTEQGKIVFEQSRTIFKAIEDMQDKINKNNETVTGTLKFVSTNSLGMSFICPSYQAMQINFPQVDIKYQLGNLNFIRNAIRQGDAEFGIVVYDQSFSSFCKQLLKRGRFHLYQNKNAPLTLIENGILVDHQEGMHLDTLREFFFRSGRNRFKVHAELAGWEVVARFTEMNIGIGFFPDYITENHRYQNLKPYPLDLPLFEYEICAIYNKGEQLSRAATTFLDQFTI